MTFPRSTARPNQAPTVWGNWSSTARHGLCIGFLLLVTAAFFSPALFEGKGIHGTDVVSWRANAEVLLDYQERTGERALWAPNTFGGMPAYMITYKMVVPQLDTVINAARSVAWPASHFFVLLASMYLLVFYLTRNHLSGLLSAVAFGFTTYIPIILAVGHSTKFVALAFAPLVVLAFAYTLRNPSVLGGLFFAAALALNLRAKHPQITYYVLMLLLAWWVVEVVWAWRNDDWAPIGKATGWLGLGTGLALLMVAHPYLAIYEYKQFSVRGAEAAAGGGGGGGMAWQKAMQWSQGPKELFTLVMAKAFGGGGQTYWGPKTFTEGPHYIGGVVVALAGLALWRVRSRLVWGLGAGVLATILFSLGKYATWVNWPMFEYFPFFNSFRAPETWLSVSAFGLALLAGVGLDHVLRQRPERSRGRPAGDGGRPLLYAFGAVLGLVLLFRVAPDLFFEFEGPNERQRLERAIQQQRPDLSIESPQVQQFIQKRIQQQKQERRAAFTSSATRTLLAVGAALFLLWLYRRETLPAWAAGGLVVLIVTIDLWGVDRQYLGGDRFSQQPDAEAQIQTFGVDRFLKKKVDEAGSPGHFRVLPLQHPAGGSPMSNAMPSYHYQSAGGYHAAKLQRYQNFIDHVLQLGQGAPNETGLDLINARYVVARQQLPGTEVAYQGGQQGFMVLENPDAVPRGFFVGQTEVVEDPEATWERLRSPSFAPDSVALLPEALDQPVTPLDSNSTPSARLDSYEPPEISWTVETDAPRLFVASEVYYPAGWNAYLDGEQVPIHRVDYLLRGVHVPAGEHTLTMRFEPSADRYGIWVAGLSTIGVYGGILLILGQAYRRRRAGVPDAPSDDE